MKKRIMIAAGVLLLISAVLLALRPWKSGMYEPAGERTGVEELDEAVLAVLQEVCDPGADEIENLGAVYDWVCREISYRPGTADTSGGFTGELINELAGELLNKRKGNCDGEAALMAVLLRRMGCDSAVVTGCFVREDGARVDHAWVVAAPPGRTYSHFDPLYGSVYAAEPRDFFMQSDAGMEATHIWDRSAYPACE